MQNYFQGNSRHPQHFSVGAILINDKNEVCCHHLIDDQLKGYWPDLGINDLYILMRETIDPGENLDSSVKRGLMEEFGAEAEIIDYLGSIKSHFKDKDVEIEKTTVYFVCKLISQDLFKRSDEDIEGKSNIEWQTANFLIPKMKEQSKKYGRTDINESEILKRFEKQLSRLP